MSRLTTSILILCLISASAWQAFSPSRAPRAEAQTVTTVDGFTGGIVPFVPGAEFATGLLAGASAQQGQFEIDNFLNGVAWLTAKVAIQSITRSVVTWINSGFQGSPAFVTNLQATMTALADTVAGNFIAGISGSSFVCSPFRLQLANIIQQQYYAGNFFLNTRCTLTGIVANTEGFLNGTFSNGGWAGWFALTTVPTNNIYGAYYAANAELGARIVNAQGQQLKLLDWGHGFFSWCGTTAASGLVENGGGSGGTEVGSGDKTGATKTASQNAGAKAIDPNKGCAPGESIQTPGSVIESQLEGQLGSGVRQLELADSINEIVGALMQQLVVQALSGAGGLLGLSQPTPGGSILNQLGDSSQSSEALNTAKQNVLTTINNDESTVFAYRSDWQNIDGAAENASSTLQDLIDECDDEKSFAEATLASDVAPILARAEAALGKAATTTAALEAMKERVITAQSADALGSASNDYTALKNASTTPTTVEIGEAAAESVDSGDREPPSILTHMNRIAEDANHRLHECSPASSGH